jgi:hypothetical protein
MCSVCDQFEARIAAGNLTVPGAVAQLVERRHGMAEAARSTRVSSTLFLPALLETWDAIGFTLGGIVAGEGCFTIAPRKPPFADGSARKRFVFQVQMATRDRRLLVALRCFLGFGSIADEEPRKPGWQPISTFTIASLKAHQAATITFAERFLLGCEKRKQFEGWRDAMAVYELEHPRKRGRSICRIPGCERSVRGRMLCRSHYYRETGY